MSASRTARGLALLGVLGCGSYDHGQPLPRCLDGQGLATDAAGNFQCTTLQPAALLMAGPAAGCASGQVLTYGTPGTIPALLTCGYKTIPVDSLRGDALRERLRVVENSLNGLSFSVDQLRPMARNEALYVGSTTVTTTGRISAAGVVGIPAANALCAAQFGDKAHMCTQFQLTRTLAAGKLRPTDRIAPAWIYMPTWHNPGSSAVEPTAGLADNCGGYTTGDDAAGWTGMAVEWSALAAGDVVFRWHGGAAAPCSASLPIACCAGGL